VAPLSSGRAILPLGIRIASGQLCDYCLTGVARSVTALAPVLRQDPAYAHNDMAGWHR